MSHCVLLLDLRVSGAGEGLERAVVGWGRVFIYKKKAQVNLCAGRNWTTSVVMTQ